MAVTGGPNSALIAQLTTQFDASPSIYDPLKNRLREETRSALSPFGSLLKWDAGSDAPTFNDKPVGNDVGDAYRRQWQQHRGQMNARGLASSSFADQDLSTRIGEVTAQAKQVRTQYLSEMEQLLRDEYGYKTGISTRIQELLAQDARYIQENPVAPTEPAPAAPPLGASLSSASPAPYFQTHTPPDRMRRTPPVRNVVSTPGRFAL